MCEAPCGAHRAAGVRKSRGQERHRVLIVDDHPPILIGLGVILAPQEDIDVCGRAGTCEEAMALTAEREPTVVVIDTTLPDLDRRACVSQLRQRWPKLGILALCDRQDCDGMLDVLAAGANGCISKAAPDPHIVRAVRAVSRGRVHLSPGNVEHLVNAYRELRRRTVSEGLAVLDDTERAVLRETAYGYTTREVAARLGMPVAAAVGHRAHVMGKLGLKTRADLVHSALAAGLLRPDASSTALGATIRL